MSLEWTKEIKLSKYFRGAQMLYFWIVLAAISQEIYLIYCLATQLWSIMVDCLKKV
jgi:hypothetical protein